MTHLLALMLLASSLAANTVMDRVGAQLEADFRFIDHHEQSHSLASLQDGKPLLVIPMYFRCPSLCGFNLQSVTDAVADLPSLQADVDFRLLAVSFDPSDSPQRAGDRLWGLQQQRAKPLPWHFAVIADGRQQEFLQQIGWQVRHVPETDQFEHPLGIILLTADGRISAQMDSLVLDPKDLETALRQAGAGDVASSTSPMTRCISYEDEHRTYNPRLASAMRISGMVILIGAFLTIIGLSVWHRSRQREEG